MLNTYIASCTNKYWIFSVHLCKTCCFLPLDHVILHQTCGFKMGSFFMYIYVNPVLFLSLDVVFWVVLGFNRVYLHGNVPFYISVWTHIVLHQCLYFCNVENIHVHLQSLLSSTSECETENLC